MVAKGKLVQGKFRVWKRDYFGVDPVLSERELSLHRFSSLSVLLQDKYLCEMANDHWQIECSTISERTKFIFNNELLSDVKFIVPASNINESESRKMIPAHKFVLAIGSPVFCAMFYGKMAESTDAITLPDCEYDSLLEFFRYLYSDEVNLTGSNVMHVLYLAKKYMVPSLVDKCCEFLRDNLEAANVFSILPHAKKFEDKDLEDRCWAVIEKQTEEAVLSEEFVTLEKSLVESLVKREVLNIKEIELFKAVDLWATKQTERQEITPDGEAKRRIIGEKALKAIRFPLMSQVEFLSVVPDSRILTTDEIVDIMKHSNGILTTPLQFSDIPRTKPFVTGNRFESLHTPEKSWNYVLGKSDRICFTVSKDVQLIGVEHFGREGSSYTVSVDLIDTVSGLCVVKKSGSYISELKQLDCKTFYGFDVLFNSPVHLKQNNCYELVSLIKGAISFYGEEGKTNIKCHGVSFTFSNSEKTGDSNGTKAERGQFPALLFQLFG